MRATIRAKFSATKP